MQVSPPIDFLFAIGKRIASCKEAAEQIPIRESSNPMSVKSILFLLLYADPNWDWWLDSEGIN